VESDLLGYSPAVKREFRIGILTPEVACGFGSFTLSILSAGVLMRYPAYIAFLLTVLLLVVGCGRKSYTFVPVSGKVTLDNKPLANATVHFKPTDYGSGDPPPECFGTTDEQGRYTLTPVGEGLTGSSGAVPGKYLVGVSISAADRKQGDAQISRDLVTKIVPPEGTSALDLAVGKAGSAGTPAPAAGAAGRKH
jgi:hypothetical protein